MSHAHDAINRQLLDELERYELVLHGLARTWEATPELVLFGEAGQSMERMRRLAGALSHVSAHWLMVMVSHAELMHDVWRASRGDPVDIARQVHDHLACTSAMAASCRQHMVQGGPLIH